MQTQVSVPRVIKMTLLGIVLLFAYMAASATPAHAHGGARTFGAVVLGAVVADAILRPRVVYAAPVVYAPQPYVVQPQPVYVAPAYVPPVCLYKPVDVYTADGQYLGREQRQICR